MPGIHPLTVPWSGARAYRNQLLSVLILMTLGQIGVESPQASLMFGKGSPCWRGDTLVELSGFAPAPLLLSDSLLHPRAVHSFPNTPCLQPHALTSTWSIHGRWTLLSFRETVEVEAVAECVGDHPLGAPMNREQNVRDHPLGSPVGRELCGC